MDRMQRPATQVSQRLVAHIQHDPARAAGLAMETVDAGAETANAGANAQPVEHGQPGWLQDEAGPQGLRRLELAPYR